jgi:hypothetical protein
MALSFSDWYKAYAAKNGVPLSDAVQGLLNNNTLTDPTYELNHQRLIGQLGGVAGTYNTAREGAAQGARTSAWNQGLSDETQVEQDGATVKGDAAIGTGDSMSYKIKMGPDGKAYRQAYLNTGAQFGARRWGGSDERGAQWKARQDLNAQRDTLTTGLTAKQGELTTEQGQKEGGVITDLSKNAGDYSGWQIQNAPAAPKDGSGAGASEDPAGDAPTAAPDRYKGIAVGGVLGTYNKAPNTDTLNKAWLKGSYKVVNKGTAKAPKYQVIRTR